MRPTAATHTSPSLSSQSHQAPQGPSEERSSSSRRQYRAERSPRSALVLPSAEEALAASRIATAATRSEMSRYHSGRSWARPNTASTQPSGRIYREAVASSAAEGFWLVQPKTKAPPKEDTVPQRSSDSSKSDSRRAEEEALRVKPLTAPRAATRS